MFQDRAGRGTSASLWIPDVYVAGDYPNVNWMWPSDRKLTCNPGGPVGMGGAFIADLGTIVSKLGWRGAMQLYLAKDNTSPMVFKITIDPAWLLEENKGTKLRPAYQCMDTYLEYLLMPIQFRY